MTTQEPPSPAHNLWLWGKNSSRFGSRAACRRSTPGVRLLPGFSHSELVIQALTVRVAPLRTPQPPRLRGGCGGDGKEQRAAGHSSGRRVESLPCSSPAAHHSSWDGLGSGDVTPCHGDIWVDDSFGHQALVLGVSLLGGHMEQQNGHRLTPSAAPTW